MLTTHRTMKALALTAAMGLWLAAAPAAAQRAVPRDGGSSSQGGGSAGQRSPSGGGSSGGGSASSGGSSTQDAGRSQPRDSGGSGAPERGDQRGARERGSRPGVAQAVPREGPVPPPRGDRDRVRGGRVYGYPWGYGGIGLYGGYYGGYYDPSWWYDPWWYGPAYGPGYGRGYGPAYGTYAARYGDSAVRLDVKPRGAAVYVDGYYAGIVDDFDGFFQRLHLDSGGHRIEFRLDGYETLGVDLYLQPDRTITYHGEMKQGTGN